MIHFIVFKIVFALILDSTNACIATVPGDFDGISVSTTTQMKVLTTTASLTTVSTTTQKVYICEDGWQLFETSCYMVSEGTNSYGDSQADCVTQGANLVSILSQEENDFVAGLISGPVWIGFRRDGAVFRWTDGSPVDFTNWDVGEPDPQICVLFRRDTEKWTAILCWRQRNYVCKKPAF